MRTPTDSRERRGVVSDNEAIVKFQIHLIFNSPIRLAMLAQGRL